MASSTASCARGSVSSTFGAQASLGKGAAGLHPASAQLRTGVPCFVEHCVSSRRQPSNVTCLAVSDANFLPREPLPRSGVGWEQDRSGLHGETRGIGARFPLSRTYRPQGWEKDRSGLDVRAGAEADGADGQVEVEAGPGTRKNGKKGSKVGQVTEKVTALEDSTIYPIMRAYRDDLCTVAISGDAQAGQAIEAMAADGGLTASEEQSKGKSLMIVETIIPGRLEDHCTVSTKLLAPTHLVNRAAKTMWIRRKVGMSSGNALAKAFQKVVMQHVLNMDIYIRSPGTSRDMTNLANEKEDAVASLESRDEKVLEGLAQVLSSYSMAAIKEDFNNRLSRKSRRDKTLAFWRKPEWVWALNKAIGIRPLSQSELREQAKRILDGKSTIGKTKRTHQAWWPAPSVSLPSNFLPEKAPEFWTTEFVPTHKLQIDTRKVKVVAKGWQNTPTEQVLELNLTHAQLVDLAGMLDLYYEDKYTTPAKTLRSAVDLKVSHISQSKVAKTVWTVVLSFLAGGVLLVGLLVVARFKSPGSTGLLSRGSSMASSYSRSQASFFNKWCRVRTDREPLLPKNEDIPAEEMELLCLQVVNTVKDAFNVPGQVQSSPDRGAWIGSDLSQWGRTHNSAEAVVGNSDKSDQQEDVAQEVEDELYIAKDSDSNSSLETLAGKPLLLYQVVLTRSGKLVGFQPGNKAAIGLWADFPFAKELHKGRRLGAGFYERGLNYSPLTEEVVAIELLCEESSSIGFTARPLRL